MHDQSEFQCDPFQDRPAEKGGQEWVELEACAFVCLRGTFFPARWWFQLSSFGVPRVQLHALTSCTVRPTAPQKGLETRRKYTIYTCTHINVHTFLPYCILVTSFTRIPVLKNRVLCRARACMMTGSAAFPGCTPVHCGRSGVDCAVVDAVATTGRDLRR